MLDLAGIPFRLSLGQPEDLHKKSHRVGVAMRDVLRDGAPQFSQANQPPGLVLEYPEVDQLLDGPSHRRETASKTLGNVGRPHTLNPYAFLTEVVNHLQIIFLYRREFHDLPKGNYPLLT